MSKRLNRKQELTLRPSDAMSPTDYMWLYISVPAIIVSALVLIKLQQERNSRFVNKTFQKKESVKKMHPFETEVKTNKEHLQRIHEIQQPETKTVDDADKPPDCPHYLGYLYMRKAPDKANIPSECYNCRRLLRCLYSPNVIEKVYGE